MKYEQLMFQPMSRPTNVTPRRSLDRHDLAEQDRRVLGDESPGSQAMVTPSGPR